MKPAQRILVDLDCTVVDILTPWLAIYNAEHGDDLTVEGILAWDMHLCAKAGAAIYDVLGREGFFRNLAPLPGAIDGLKALIAAGHKVLIVTAGETPIAYKEKVEWVRHYLPFIGKRDLFIAHDKYLLTADALIDDNPLNAVAYRNAHPKAFIATIAYPYNLGIEAYDMIAFDWRNPKIAWTNIVDALIQRGLG